MHRLLVAVDGSQQAERAVRYLIGLIRDGGLLGGDGEVHLINVNPNLRRRSSAPYPLPKSIVTSRGRATMRAGWQRIYSGLRA